MKSRAPHWWVKIGDFGISKRIEESRKQTATIVGTPGFMAPELNEFLVPRQESDSIDEYAADMWSLGEITFQILTSQPSFANAVRLLSYIRDEQPFPTASLHSHGVSATGQKFIISIMCISPIKRLTADQALKHDWVEQYMRQRTRPSSPPSNESVTLVIS